MKKIIVFIVFIFSVFLVTAQRLSNGTYKAFKLINEEEIPDEIMAHELGNGSTLFTSLPVEGKYKPLDGKYYIETRGKMEHAIAHFSKGRPDGEWLQYETFPVRLTGKYFFTKGLFDGEKYSYWHNSTTCGSKTLYKNSVKQHEITYHKNGQVESEKFFDDDGKEHGQVIVYDEKEKVLTILNYSHGLYHGDIFKTHENGFQETNTYNHGKMEGKYTLKYPNGNKQVEGEYSTGGFKNGKWTFWYDNGEIETEEHFQNGKRHGEKRNYYKGGILSLIEEYKEDQLDGKRVEYEENPHNQLTQATYKKGKLDGVFKAFNNGQLWRDCVYKEGQLISEKEYKNGKLNVLRIIDETGNLVDVQKYNESGKSVYKNNTYKKPASITLKEDASGVIDIVY